MLETLRNLEDVQKVLSFIKAVGLSSNCDDSDRFIGHFILFMLRTCGALSIEAKCSLICEVVQKISANVLEEASRWVTAEGSSEGHDEPPFWCDLEKSRRTITKKSNINYLPTVGFEAMRQANSTLDDFCQSYFMFHGMDANNVPTIFSFLPVLCFMESYIYQLDMINEKILNLPDEGSALQICKDTSACICKVDSQENHYMELIRSDPFEPLIYLLEQLGLLTRRIKAELSFGVDYWTLERKLCSAVTRKNKVLLEDVMRAISLKSFDYRVLNLLLYQLTGQPVNELHMEFLSVSEFLVEVADDLFDYEDDVIKNNFNILRMYHALYGPSMAPLMLAKCISEAEAKYMHLSRNLDPELASSYWRRCEEAAKEGQKASGRTFGTWCIPHLIVDEDSYRAQMMACR